MKTWCNIDEEYVYLKEPVAALGEIWECEGCFYLTIERARKYGESDFRYKIYQIYPATIRSKEDKFLLENKVFTFVCPVTELSKFLKDQYIKACIPF